MMLWSTVLVAYCWCVLHVCVLIPWTTCSDPSERVPMRSDSFEGLDSIRLVMCDGVGDKVKGLKIEDSRNTSGSKLVTARFTSGGLICKTNSSFAACTVRQASPRNISLRVIITDLEPGEVREYTCSVTKEISDTGGTDDFTNTINVSRPVTTTTTTTVPPSTAATEIEQTSKTGQSANYSSSNSTYTTIVIYVMPIFLVLLVILCTVLLVSYCRRRRRSRRSRDCDVMSIRSGVTDKSFYAADPLTCRGYVQDTLPRPFAPQRPYASPGANVKDGPSVVASRRVMHYQKPSDSLSMGGVNPAADRSFMSESMVHYHEPWGGRVLDDPEILSQMSTLCSPNRHLVQVPNFDAASSALIAYPARPTNADTPPLVPEVPPPPSSSAVSGDAFEMAISPPTQEIGNTVNEATA